MTALADRVRRTLHDHDLIPRASRVVVAVSGGADSVALVHVLRELAAVEGFAVAGVVHFNHQLRGGSSDQDEVFCRELAAALSLPVVTEAGDVRTLARERGTSIEDAARVARYAFFDRAASRVGADRVAVGHTRDDQAETFMLRLLRGAGPRGLAGIYPRSGLVVRPFLDVSRQEIRDYLDARAIAFRDDETNRDVRIPRNRVRHELIPYLQRDFAPGLVEVLAREAAIAREDADWLDRTANETARRIVLYKGGRVEVDAAALAALPPALARRVVQQALSEAAGGRFVGYRHVDRVLRLAAPAAEGSGPVDLPGHRAGRVGGTIVLTRRSSGRGPAPARLTSFAYPLSIPGEVRLAELGLAISAHVAEPAQRPPVSSLASRGDWVAVESTQLIGPLAVRSWKPGDMFRPLGLGGRKKLQDFFVDRKIARPERGTVPLVVDVQDRIVWIVGLAVSHDFRVTEATRAMILLRVRRL